MSKTIEKEAYREKTRLGVGRGTASQDNPGAQDLPGKASQVKKKAVCPPPILLPSFSPSLSPSLSSPQRLHWASCQVPFSEAANDVYLLPSLGSFELRSPGTQALWPQGLNGSSYTEEWTGSP